MRVLTWLLRAFLFFTLFAFALNNQEEAVVRWFFGHEWRTAMVYIVLAAFALGCALGVLAMLPSWLRLRRRVQEPPVEVTPIAGSPAAPRAGSAATTADLDSRPPPLPDLPALGPRDSLRGTPDGS